MTDIRLYNTRTRTKDRLEPLDPLSVRMYVCGPTVYDRAHIGNARPAVVFDVLFRLLRHAYGEDHVTYVRNITDVDDKINARAAATRSDGETELEAIRRITEETVAWYRDDMAALGNLPPTHEPRATGYIAPMVAMIETLIDKGHAYAAEGHVLFSVSSDPDYGKFANRSLDDMRAGARVEVAPYKRDPMDFVLWKPSDATQPGWDSPWGHGRPGWHIECSAMSHELLGPSFDIHGGGIDLVFPHHENEIAQSRCAHPEGSFANIWMHNGFVNVGGEKMAKSLGNFVTVRDVLDHYRKEYRFKNFAPAVRLRLLTAHYRAPVDAGPAFLEEAATKLGNYHHALRGWRCLGNSDARAAVNASGVIDALSDDLNTPQAIAVLDALVKEIRTPLPSGSVISSVNKPTPQDQLGSALDFLGFTSDDLLQFDWARRSDELRAELNRPHASKIEALLEDRQTARARKDFRAADTIRDGLLAAGVEVTDAPDGATWSVSANFDPRKLEAL